MDHGSRQHACHMSPIFRQHATSIIRAMARHFAGPMFAKPEDRAHFSAAQSDRARGYAGNFIVPEHQSCPGG